MNKYQEALHRLDENEYEEMYDEYGCYIGNDVRDGDINILKELVEKATSKKPDSIYKRCSRCCHKIGWNYYADRKLEYCPNCGQSLDWSDEND